MPTEIFNKNDFIKYSEQASECRVKRVKDKDVVKLKLRTLKRLVIIKLDHVTAEEVLKDIHCEIVEV